MSVSTPSKKSSRPRRYPNGTQFRMRSALVVQATGTGKTVTFAELGVRTANRTSKSVLYLVDTDELVHQTERKLRAAGATDIGIEKAGKTLAGARRLPLHVIGSVQTLRNQRRIQHLDPHSFSLVVSDEADLSVAPGWRRILTWFDQNPQVVHVGFTATPQRADGLSLGTVFQKVAYELPIGPAIERGWLVPPRQRVVTIAAVDFSRVDRTKGDLTNDEVASIMRQEESLHGVVDATVEQVGDRKTIIFTADVAQAQLIADILQRRREESAAWVSGETPLDARRAILRKFAEGGTQFLVNCAVLTRGFDVPDVSAVVVARPTKSLALYTQMVGRGLRPLDGLADQFGSAEERRAAIAASTKPECLVLDFADNSGRHKFLSTVDLLGGEYPEPVRLLAAEELANGSGKSFDVGELLERKKEAYERAEAERIERERREREARDRRRHIVGKADYRTAEVSLFKGPKYRSKDGAAKGEGPNRLPLKMVNRLKSFGVPDETIARLAIEKAAELMEKCIARRRDGLCTYRQALLLRSLKYPTTDTTFDQANEWINACKANNWRRPE